MQGACRGGASRAGTRAGPLTPGGYVAVADVAHYGGTRPLGYPRRSPELEATQGRAALDPVVDGLAVRADNVDRAMRVCQLARCGSKGFTDRNIKLAHLFDRGGGRRQYRGDGVAEARRVRDRAVLEERSRQGAAVGLELDGESFDGVERRP